MGNRIYMLSIIFLLPTIALKSQSIKTIYFSDSLIISYNNEPRQEDNSKFIEVTFGSSFDDSVKLSVNKKMLFYKYLKTNKNLGTVLQMVHKVKIPKRRNNRMDIYFKKEKYKVSANLLAGYNYLYIYKHLKQITLYFINKELWAE